MPPPLGWLRRAGLLRVRLWSFLPLCSVMIIFAIIEGHVLKRLENTEGREWALRSKRAVPLEQQITTNDVGTPRSIG